MVRRMVWVAALAFGVTGPVDAVEEVGAQRGDETERASLAAEDLAPRPSGEAASPVRVSMEFQETQLGDVLKVFSQQTGINLIASEEVSSKLITVYLEDVEVLDALDQILAAGNLTYERAAGSDIYLVKAKTVAEDALAKTITRVYRLKYARVSASVLARAASSFGKSTPFEATVTSAASGSSSSSGGGGGSATGDSGIDLIIKELLTEHGNLVVDGRTNRLIVTDLPENFPRIEAALAALDVRTPQIMVAAEVIETSLDKAKDLGVEWSSAVEGDLLTLTPSSRTTRFPFGWIGHTDAPSNPTSFSLSTLSAASAVGILQALQTDTRTKILARPKVLTLDNESAVIRLTADEAIGFAVSTETTTGTTTAEPERTTTGVVLVVTPQVNEDGYITMIVEPSVTKTVASKITPPTGQATPRDPKTRGSRTIVRIRNGDTLVVGGLIDRSEQDLVRRVPILGDIPFVGAAFRNNELTSSASELLVFMTPRILDEPSEAQRATASPGPVEGREQERLSSRQAAIEETLNRLEP